MAKACYGRIKGFIEEVKFLLGVMAKGRKMEVLIIKMKFSAPEWRRKK